jgi:hypothetical protein
MWYVVSFFVGFWGTTAALWWHDRREVLNESR